MPAELDSEKAYLIGRASAAFFREGILCVGRDARSSSPKFFEALVRGLTETGISVIDIGLVSTPMLYHAVAVFESEGGIMITASHNPSGYNGFKICAKHARPVGEETGLREIEAFYKEIPSIREGQEIGTVSQRDVSTSYAAQCLEVGNLKRPLTVVIDAGNGMAAAGLDETLRGLDLKVIKLYYEPDGLFPNHPADPLNPDNLKDLQKVVIAESADLGVAFDGDADRAIFVDNKGQIVSSDLITALLARACLSKNEGGKILYDLRSSWVTAEEIEKAGGTAEICRVGHSFVKAQMRKSGAIFAGELSGHYYFRFGDQLVADDAVAAFVGVLDVVSRAASFSDLVAPLRRYHATGELNRKVSDAQKVIELIAEEHLDADEVSRLDGLLVRYKDWWFNLRPSNTEPVIRLNLEAKTRGLMESHRDRILALLEREA